MRERASDQPKAQTSGRDGRDPLCGSAISAKPHNTFDEHQSHDDGHNQHGGPDGERNSAVNFAKYQAMLRINVSVNPVPWCAYAE